jgi:predicted short-subunit dehydrogenase-like oxidoreductase (DUF2520 family)
MVLRAVLSGGDVPDGTSPCPSSADRARRGAGNGDRIKAMNDERVGPCAVVGRGRVGTALVDCSDRFAGPFGHGFDGTGPDGTVYGAVLLAVPDTRIAAAAAAIAPGRLVGHCSGATGLDVLSPHEAFGLHPLMTVTPGSRPFAGAGAAVAGSTRRALATAWDLAHALGMTPFEIADADRAAYHAAASIASNFLVTIEDAAERLLATTGAPRAMLVPLVRAAVESWAALGGPAALTGPVSRGDEATVTRQRVAVAERAPEDAELFDALVEATRRLALRRGEAPGGSPISPAPRAGGRAPQADATDATGATGATDVTGATERS